MDKSERPPAGTGEVEAAARLLNEGQAVIGCPPWCSWAESQPGHLHYLIDEAELVVGIARSLDGDALVEVALEVKHTPRSARVGLDAGYASSVRM